MLHRSLPFIVKLGLLSYARSRHTYNLWALPLTFKRTALLQSLGLSFSGHIESLSLHPRRLFGYPLSFDLPLTASLFGRSFPGEGYGDW